ncbi:MAG: mechanosensitive ion channel [Bacteroidota bacterium]|nr:mechanosensitive ion channel [Bacteroidota bacterium]
MNVEKIEQISQSTHAISDWSIQLLSGFGIPEKWVNSINTLFLGTLLVLLVLILQYVTKAILKYFLNRAARYSKTVFLQKLSESRFSYFMAMVVPFSLVKGTIPIVFEAFPKLMNVMDKLADIFFIFYMVWLIMSVVNAFTDTLRQKPGLKDKPLDSFAQVVKIVLYFIAIIILFSILTSQKPGAIIAGLGAASAIFMLIFKDSILGFVASLQVSANDMVRIGDWITMPKHGADGNVVQITLTTVKVQNFDNTITTIPPYALVSDSFQNWRGMQEAGGRRRKRSIFIKHSTIRFLRDEELEELSKITIISDYIRERSQEIAEFNRSGDVDKSLLINGRNLTNLGLYRMYIKGYLDHHPEIRKDMTLMVRQLDPTSKGLPLELYFFTDTIVWADYENIVSDVFDHVIAAAGYFHLELFEDVSNPITTSVSPEVTALPAETPALPSEPSALPAETPASTSGKRR